MVESYTSTGLFDAVNGIIELIKAPGKLFFVESYGLVHGIVFLGIIGTILALTAIGLGLH